MILDEIKQMQQQGFTEQDVVQKLMESGYSPKDISDSINQTKIKSAVEDNVQNSVINQGMQMSSLPQQNQQGMPQPGTEQVTQDYYQAQQQTMEHHLDSTQLSGCLYRLC